MWMSDKQMAMDILATFPEDAKTMQESGDLMQIYGTELYLQLFEFFSSSTMPYDTQKGRDGDPVQFMQDSLDDWNLMEISQ